MNAKTTFEQLVIALDATPKQIQSLSRPLSEAELCAVHESDGWSANDVLAHLRACADVWGNYIAIILAEDAPTIRAMSPRTWAKRTGYATLGFHVSLDAYTKQRDALLDALRGLSVQRWGSTATVIHGAKRKQHSVETYADMLVSHEQAHVQQLERIVRAARTTNQR